MTTAVDEASGRLALTRVQLGALADVVAGRAAAPEAVRALEAAGAMERGEPHPLLSPVLRTLATVRGWGALRRWHGRAWPVVEIMVGAGGVVVLPGGPAPEAVQELRWHPRPAAAGRIVSELLALPSRPGPPVAGSGPTEWSELVALASAPGRPVGLADLRWSAGLGGPLASVLVLAWHDGGGIDRLDPEGDGSTVRATAVHPLEVWTGLTRLSAA
ncbi:MAG TPA: hypothetical protein VH479_07630 [Acidimicrobiales bacterium]